MGNTKLNKDQYIQLLEKCEKEDAMNTIYFLMGSLISADTMIDEVSCDESIQELSVILKAVKEAQKISKYVFLSPSL